MQSVDYKQLLEWQQEGKDFDLIDVREEFEHEHFNIGGRNIPLGEIGQNLQHIAQDKAVVVYCAKGIRSVIAIQKLMQKGYTNLYNLSGGVYALSS